MLFFLFVYTVYTHIYIKLASVVKKNTVPDVITTIATLLTFT